MTSRLARRREGGGGWTLITFLIWVICSKETKGTFDLVKEGLVLLPLTMDNESTGVMESFTSEQNNTNSIYKTEGHNNNNDNEEDDIVTLNMGSQWTYLLENINHTLGGGGGDGSLMFKEFSTPEQHIFGTNRSQRRSQDEYLIIPRSLIQESFDFANEKWLERQQKIENVFFNKSGADSQSPVGTAFAFSPPNPEAIALSNTSILLEFASREFLKNIQSAETGVKSRVRRSSVTFQDENGVRSEGTTKGGSPMDLDVRSFFLEASSRQGQGSMGKVKCGMHDEVLPCDSNNPYRTYSGWCNNVQNPGWGKSVITFDRMVPSAYSDGVSKPRATSVTGSLLPSPRIISGYVHVDVSHLSNKHTLMLMQYAQFLDHDMTLTPVHKGPEEKILNCRDCESSTQTHPECYPIPVPQGDAWYPNTRQDTGRPYCIPFTRSLPGQQRLGPREQINQNTAYIDASQIYGEDVCKADTLRIAGGRLNGTASSGRKTLMPQTGSLKECKSPSGYCFYAGDPRASEQPALAAVHTVFLRQHNQWSADLKRINPHWNDEKIYQEVRKIMGAANQHFTYNELLPRILGPSMINAYGLRLQSEGYYAGYDASCPANVYNEFATAAFRFGHSLIRPQLARMDGRYRGMNPHLQLRDGFFNSDMLYKHMMVDEVIRGLLAEPMEQLDPFVTNEITNHLFEDNKKSFSGLDLISLNIQRARDHGLPGYNSYRSVCNLKKAKNFEELSSEIPTDVLQRIQKVYVHVDDIDIFTGALVERPVTGGLLGPVMTCIIGTQFKRLRTCDRFWYETNNKAIRFSPQQLAEIRKMTLSKLMCDNMEVPTDTQRWAMDAPHNVLNPRLPCGQIAGLNLEHWREEAPHYSTPSIPQALVSPTRGCNIGGKSIPAGGSALQSPCVSCVCTTQGTKCASLRITSCSKLYQQASRSEILRDTVCTSQCGYSVGQIRGAPSKSRAPVSKIPPSSRIPGTGRFSG